MPSRAPASAARAADVSRAAERVLGVDLEFDPISASSAKQPAVQESRGAAPAVAHEHFVPDLELAPPPASRRLSDARPIELPAAAQASALDFDDAPAPSAPLALDLSPDEPLARRAASSPRMPAIQVPAQRPSTPPSRSLSGSTAVVRDAVPPVSAATAAPRNPQVELDWSPNSASAARSQPRASVPPPSPVSGASMDTGFIGKLDLSFPEERPLMRRLRPAFVLLGAAIFVALLDPIYAAATGEILKLLGLRLSVFAGALLLLALGLGIRESMREA